MNFGLKYQFKLRFHSLYKLMRNAFETIDIIHLQTCIASTHSFYVRMVIYRGGLLKPLMVTCEVTSTSIGNTLEALVTLELEGAYMRYIPT